MMTNGDSDNDDNNDYGNDDAGVSDDGNASDNIANDSNGENPASDIEYEEDDDDDDDNDNKHSGGIAVADDDNDDNNNDKSDGDNEITDEWVRPPISGSVSRAFETRDLRLSGELANASTTKKDENGIEVKRARIGADDTSGDDFGAKIFPRNDGGDDHDDHDRDNNLDASDDSIENGNNWNEGTDTDRPEAATRKTLSILSEPTDTGCRDTSIPRDCLERGKRWMKSKLAPHQQVAVGWMLERERITETPLRAREKDGKFVSSSAVSPSCSPVSAPVSTFTSTSTSTPKFTRTLPPLSPSSPSLPPSSTLPFSSQDSWTLSRRASRGGILADDMGLGKTVSCLALIAMSPDQDAPTLVVTPLSLLNQWIEECAKHCQIDDVDGDGGLRSGRRTGMKVVAYRGETRHERLEWVFSNKTERGDPSTLLSEIAGRTTGDAARDPGPRIVVTTYDVVRSEYSALKANRLRKMRGHADQTRNHHSHRYHSSHKPSRKRKCNHKDIRQRNAKRFAQESDDRPSGSNDSRSGSSGNVNGSDSGPSDYDDDDDDSSDNTDSDDGNIDSSNGNNDTIPNNSNDVSSSNNSDADDNSDGAYETQGTSNDGTENDDPDYEGASRYKSRSRKETTKKTKTKMKTKTNAKTKLKASKGPDVGVSGLFGKRWQRIILDEAHCIRRFDTLGARSVCALRDCGARWAVTGTPFSNSIDDVVSLCRFVGVAPWSSPAWWKRVTHPSAGSGAFQELTEWRSRFVLRRTKNGSGVVRLPRKVKHKIEIVLDAEERSTYDRICTEDVLDRWGRYQKIEGALTSARARASATSRSMVRTLQLRQACMHTDIVSVTNGTAQNNTKSRGTADNADRQDDRSRYNDVKNSGTNNKSANSSSSNRNGSGDDDNDSDDDNDDNEWGSDVRRKPSIVRDEPWREALITPRKSINKRPGAKVAAVIAYCRDWSEPDAKFVVFSQWTRSLEFLGKHLVDSGIACMRYDGSLDSETRASVMRRFRDADDERVLLCSITCAAVGLNITRASHAIFLDPWFNPAIEDQAVDRIHRMGQTREVHVVKIVASEPAETNVVKMQEFRRRRGAALLGCTCDPDAHDPECPKNTLPVSLPVARAAKGTSKSVFATHDARLTMLKSVRCSQTPGTPNKNHKSAFTENASADNDDTGAISGTNDTASATSKNKGANGNENKVRNNHNNKKNTNCNNGNEHLANDNDAFNNNTHNGGGGGGGGGGGSDNSDNGDGDGDNENSSDDGDNSSSPKTTTETQIQDVLAATNAPLSAPTSSPTPIATATPTPTVTPTFMPASSPKLALPHTLVSKVIRTDRPAAATSAAAATVTTKTAFPASTLNSCSNALVATTNSTTALPTARRGKKSERVPIFESKHGHHHKRPPAREGNSRDAFQNSLPRVRPMAADEIRKAFSRTALMIIRASTRSRRGFNVPLKVTPSINIATRFKRPVPRSRRSGAPEVIKIDDGDDSSGSDRDNDSERKRKRNSDSNINDSNHRDNDRTFARTLNRGPILVPVESIDTDNNR